MSGNIKVVGRWCIVIALFAYGAVVLSLTGFFVMKNITAVKANLWSYLTTAPLLFSPILAAIKLWPRAEFKARVKSRPRTAKDIQEALVAVIGFVNPEYTNTRYENICSGMNATHGFSERKTRQALEAACNSGRLEMLPAYPGAKLEHCRGTSYHINFKWSRPT